jgi:ABC-type amino acid transport substrate-binding protein
MKAKNNFITRILLLVAIVLSLILPVSCSNNTDALEAIKKAGKLVVGTSADYAPYEFHVMIDGKDTIVGFDIDIIKEVAKDLGVTLHVQDIAFDGLLQALNSKKIDLVISGMTPTEERKKSVDFSKVYYTARQSMIVRKTDVNTYTTVNSLKGRSIGVQLSSTQEELAKEFFPESRTVSLGKIYDLILELKNNKVDAVILELPVAQGYVLNNNDLVIASVPLPQDEGGSAIAVRKGSETLLQSIDKTLTRLMNDGSIDTFVRKANELNVAE